jgi:hypothetical protein
VSPTIHDPLSTIHSASTIRSATRRRGAILVAVIVCLVIASSLLVSTLGVAVSQRHAVEVQLWRIEAEWLAQSGLGRAAARLAADAHYAGETWWLPAEEFGGREAAVVRIEVKAVPGEPGRRSVRVEADYPDDPQQRARHTSEALLEVRQ